MLDVHGSVLGGLQHDENGNKTVGLGPTPGDLPDRGTEPESLASPELAGGFFTAVPPGKLPGRHGLLQSHSFHWKKRNALFYNKGAFLISILKDLINYYLFANRSTVVCPLQT